MKTISLFILVSIFVFSGCSPVKQASTTTPPNIEKPQQLSEAITDNSQNTTPPSGTPALPVWNGDGSSTFTSNLFNLKLTVSKNVLVSEDGLISGDGKGISFTFDSEAHIDSNGAITYGTPYLMGQMKADPEKTLNDFLDTEKSHQHKDFTIKEFKQDEKMVTHYSFLANCEGTEGFDNLYVVEHSGYLLEFNGHECMDMGDIVKTLEFLE